MENLSILKEGQDNKGNIVQLAKGNIGQYVIKIESKTSISYHNYSDSKKADSMYNSLVSDRVIPFTIMSRVREMLDIDENDNSQDEKIMRKYDNKELFDMYLRYEGIIGYSDTILNTIEALFNVELK
jgi:hypothetical protein